MPCDRHENTLQNDALDWLADTRVPQRTGSDQAKEACDDTHLKNQNRVLDLYRCRWCNGCASVCAGDCRGWHRPRLLRGLRTRLVTTPTAIPIVLITIRTTATAITDITARLITVTGHSWGSAHITAAITVMEATIAATMAMEDTTAASTVVVVSMAVAVSMVVAAFTAAAAIASLHLN